MNSEHKASVPRRTIDFHSFVMLKIQQSDIKFNQNKSTCDDFIHETSSHPFLSWDFLTSSMNERMSKCHKMSSDDEKGRDVLNHN